MKTVDYLREIYGYSVPIFLKDIRIGRKSKVSIRKDLSRAVEKGEIVRDGQGVYYFDPKNGLPTTLSFTDILIYRFVRDELTLPGAALDVYGYFTGEAFLNSLGISQQVPAVYEVVTNNTSCKRTFTYGGYKAILRKSKVTIISMNYKILQFLDAFYYLNQDEIRDNRELLKNYISKNLSRNDYLKYIDLYPNRIRNAILVGGLLDAFG